MHAKLSGITCKKCSYKPIDRHDLKVHRKSTHASDDFMCGDCEYRAFRQQDLKKHFQRVHEKRRDHKCIHCDYAAFEKKRLRKHVISVHNGKFPCKMCSYKSPDMQDLKQHVMLAHEPADIEHNTTPRQEIDLNRDTADPREVHDTEEVWLKAESKDEGSYKIEIEDPLNITIKGDYKCQMCNFAASENSELRRHASIIHEERIGLKCGLCDYAARDRRTLQRHISRIHERQRKYKCDRCDYAATDKQYLVNHVLCVHEKRRDNKCAQCDFASFDKRGLRNHVKSMHSNINGKPVIPICIDEPMKDLADAATKAPTIKVKGGVRLRRDARNGFGQNTLF